MEKGFESGEIDLPIGRKLEQYRAQLISQQVGTGKELLETRRGIGQLLHVREKSASLHGEAEVRRCRTVPILVQRVSGGRR